MADTAYSPAEPKKKGLFEQMEIDTRLLGMIGAFVIMCIGFHLFTGGRFLTPRNIFTISIQTVSIAIMAMGMVFVIVTRHIDLSVGSLLALCSATMAVLQTQTLPNTLGLGFDHPLTMPIAVLSGVIVGAAVGGFHGWLVGYLTIPSFIVTLGGLLIWNRVAYYSSGGQTIGPLDNNFLIFGGTNGTLGEMWSWIVGGIAVLAAFYVLWSSRRNKLSHGFAVKPAWAEVLLALIIAVAIVAFVGTLNAYDVPTARLERLFEARGDVMPEGYTQGYGIPVSVLILIILAIVMTVIGAKTRFGRYIYAAGGNPSAAELSGINTRMLTVKIFALMGGLCGLSAVVASARLTNHSLDIGSLDELRTIAAAVIGGTALAGGIGTIYGAILGAVIMQSLQAGMAMVNVDAPIQRIVVGTVLVLAVYIDILYRKRTGAK